MEVGKSFKLKRGLTFLEALISVFLIAIVFLGIYGAYQLGMWVVGNSKAKFTALSLSTQEMERLRNLNYPDVVSTTTYQTVNNFNYKIETSVMCVDDEKDGKAGTGDGCICDYKKVRVKTSWSGKFKGEVYLDNIISPRNNIEECQVPAGVISISVFNAIGEAVEDSEIEVKNATTGEIYLGTKVGPGEYEYIVPPAKDVYKISVTKENYSQSRTYAKGEIYNGKEIATPANQCFARPQATVLNAQRTEISFCIDYLSNFLIKTLEARAKKIYYVRKTGSDSNDGLTPNSAFLTIQKAASVAQPGDWVLVGAGEYEERVEILNSGTSDNYIYFVADKDGIYTGDKGEVKISGKDFGFYISSKKYIEIYGFKIENTTSSAILISGSNAGYIKIYQNIISNNSGNGIYVDGASNIEVIKNEIFASQIGIYLKNSSNSQIKANKVYQNSSDGIKVESSNSVSLIFNESFSNGGKGIFILTNSNNCEIKNNLTYLNNGAGIEVFDHASQIEILNNKSYSNSGAGISFKGNISNANKILSNLIYSNSGPGILLSNNCVNNDILNNTLFLNQNGILIELNSNNNKIKNNIVASSSFSGIKVSESTNIEEDFNDLWQNNPNYDGISPGPSSISVDPLFVDPDGNDNILGGENGKDDSFHLSQIDAGQSTTSQAVDKGSDTASNLGLSEKTTRTDNVTDSGIVDMGFHYSLETPPSVSFPHPFGPKISNVQFNLRGEKYVGEDKRNKLIYKYSTTTQTDPNGNLKIYNLEWDNYHFSDFVAAGQSLDLILSYPSQMPIYLAPNTTTTVLLGLKAENTLLVKVFDASTLVPIGFAEVKIQNGGTTKIEITDQNGEAYFIPLAPGWYQITTKAQGYATSTNSVHVVGHVEKTIFLQKE